MQRQIQRQLEDEQRYELENAKLDQFNKTFASVELLNYWRHNNVKEEDVFQDFESHLPTLRQQIKPQIM